ncbi:MAG: ABC transporter permease [Planctomycetota bacterium]|nr:ABC transporter permease [Planctomycetota bacterium]
MLPFSYALRNLWRLRSRAAITLGGVTVITTLVVLMGGFASGLSATARDSAARDVMVLTGNASEHDMVRSVITRGNAEAAAAGLPHVAEIAGQRAVSVELHIATRRDDRVGLMRGVTDGAWLVHRRVTVVEGREPREPFELVAGRLAAARMGLPQSDFAVGRVVELEGIPWTVVGRFAAPGTVLEAELWGRLDDVSLATKRMDVSCVAARLADPADMGKVGLWVNRNGVQYEIAGVPETTMFETLQRALDPIAGLAWVMALLVLVGGIFACANTMFAAVLARTREMGALRAIGYGPLAVGVSLMTEALLLGAIGGLLGFWIAGLFGEIPLKFPMGAFYLDLSPTIRLAGLGSAVLAGLLGGLIPAWRAVRMPLPDALGGKS